MRSSSYTLLSRLRHTHRFNSHCQSQFLLFHYSDPKLTQNNDCSLSQNAPFSSSADTLLRGLVSSSACSKRLVLLDLVSSGSVVHHQHQQQHLFHRNFFTRAKQVKIQFNDEHSQRAVTTALWCNFLVFSLKFGVWLSTASHVMFAEVVHSVADFANQALLAYGLSSSRRAPDALHPYGYSKERFVWSLISAVGIFCLGSGATIVHGFQNLWTSQVLLFLLPYKLSRKVQLLEGMKLRDYIWRGHDPTSVAVMTEDGAAVTGLAIAAASLVAVNRTGNAIYDPIGSIVSWQPTWNGM
ncbi:unnamed protein product [Prunus armeniaca]